MILVFHSLQSYVIDTFTLHAASGSFQRFIKPHVDLRICPQLWPPSRAFDLLLALDFPYSPLPCKSFLHTVTMRLTWVGSLQRYQALGYGKGDTILAVLGIVLGWPACVDRVSRSFIVYTHFTSPLSRPFLFWRFGERIRQRSSYVQ